MRLFLIILIAGRNYGSVKNTVATTTSLFIDKDSSCWIIGFDLIKVFLGSDDLKDYVYNSTYNYAYLADEQVNCTGTLPKLYMYM